MSEVARLRPKPTAQVEPFVEALGYDEAVTFLMHFGGAGLYLAKSPKGRSASAEMFGADAMAKLAASDRIPPKSRIPLAKPWMARVFAWRGHSTASIARTLRATEVTVRRWLKDGMQHDGQARHPRHRLQAPRPRSRA